MSDDTAPHAGHGRSIRNLLTGIFLILAIMGLYFAKEVLLPVILGVLIALTLSPVVRALSRLRIPAGVSAAVIIAGLGAGVFSIAYVMSGPISGWIAEAPAMGFQLKQKLKGVNETVEAVQEASEEVDKLAETAKSPEVQKVSIEQPGLLNYAVSNLASAATSAVVALILALFLLASDDMFYEKLIASFPKFGDKKRALQVAYDIERKVSRYLLTITIINAVLGCSIGAVLALVGLPDAYIWGVFAFLLNFLPFIGSIVGTLLVGVFSIVSFDSLSYALLAPAAYISLTALEGQILTPMIVGRRLELNTVSVFLTVVFWGWLWGIAGALTAVPFLVLVKVICDNVDGLATFGRFLSARDPGLRE